MAEGGKPASFLALFGPKLLDAGYEIIPIRRGSKRPRGDQWESLRATPKLLRQWIDAGTQDGVGVLTRKTPAVDIDVQDEEMALALEAFVRENYGEAPVRIGLAPKRLLVFRASKTFPKVTSASYIDPEHATDPKTGRPLRTRVEVLGDGQQFVSNHVHPDTQKPYRWLYGKQLAAIPHDDLPELTHEQAKEIALEFERLAKARGWKLHSAGRDRPVAEAGEYDDDDPFADVAQKTDITDDDLKAELLLVPNAEDYETWNQVGMALYHQYDGDQLGLDLWHEWSITAENYDIGALEDRWHSGSFKIAGKGRQPITARYILRLAKEHKQKIAVETFAEIKAELIRAPDLTAFREVCDKIKHIEFDKIARSQLVHLVKTQFKKLTDATLGVVEARDLVRFESAENKTPPWWIEGWVFCTIDGAFYNIRERRTMGKTEFNDAHARHMLTKKDVLEGRSISEHMPSSVALNLYQIPVVEQKMYLPGEDDLFSYNGVPFVNSYNPTNVPELVEDPGRVEREAVEIVEHHFEHLFPNARDRGLFIDWLAFIVQNPGRHPNWAVLLQGTEGDGKTFFYKLLMAVLGPDNNKTITAKALEERNNAWAEGAQIVFVEEIRLAGHNRHDILNAVKPMITNDMVSIRRMNVDWYDTLNVTSYLLTTNFRDALPLNENDTRYFILFSRFQTKSAIDEFKRANPKYYVNLFGALKHNGALRGWLMNRKFSKEFDADARAPFSMAKAEMASYAKSDEAEALEIILAESPRADMTIYLLNASDLPDEMAEHGVEMPYGQSANKLLISAGFTLLGRAWVGPGKNDKARYWSQRPYMFLGADGKIDQLKVRKWMTDAI